MHGVMLQEWKSLRPVLNDYGSRVDMTTDLASTHFGPYTFNQQRWSLKSYRTAESASQRLQRVHRSLAHPQASLWCRCADGTRE